MPVTEHHVDPRDVAAAVAADIADKAARLLHADPDLTTSGLLAHLRARAVEFAAMPAMADRKLGHCTSCHRPVGRRVDGSLTHLRPDGELSMKGCRPASWGWAPGGEGSWDDSLQAHWQAKLRR